MEVSLRSVLVVVCLASISGVAQDAPNSAGELARVSRELQETRSQLAESRQEIEELRHGLAELRQQVQANRPLGTEATVAAEPTVAAADQDVGFLSAKV